VRPPRLEKGCGSCLFFALIYALSFALYMMKITINLQSGDPKSARLISTEHDSFSRLGRRLAVASTGLLAPSLSVCTSGVGVNLGQCEYLPSCQTKGLTASANIESKPSVRDLMWSACGVTPKSSWICLLLRYQGAPVTKRRPLDCCTCSLPKCLRAANIEAGHA
jgi:hypothetical protein